MAKKQPAKKPARFQIEKFNFAECRSYPSGRMVLIDFWKHLNSSRSARLAAWMTKAAAWCNEKPRTRTRKERRDE